MNDSRVGIVTGSNTGIGLQVVKRLCREGWDIILACRNQEKACTAIEDIKQTTADAKVTFIQLDLADLASVRTFVTNFHNSGKKLHLLMNNAGLMTSEKRFTKDGFELTVGTSHFGHFLLTMLLLEDIKKTAAEFGEARIINVTSAIAEDMSFGPKFKPIDFDDVMYSKKGSWNDGQAYRDSKVMNAMFTYELARRLNGTGVSVNCVHPGMVPGSEIFRDLPCCFKCLFSCCVPMLRCCRVAISLEESADELVDLATLEKYKGVTGAYFSKGCEAATCQESKDEENQRKLWTISVQLVKLEPSSETDSVVNETT